MFPDLSLGRVGRLLPACLFLASFAAACSDGAFFAGVNPPGLDDLPPAPTVRPSDPDAPILGPDGQPIQGAGLGDTCDDSVRCRPGLACTDGACAAEGNTPQGSLCTLGAECASGLTCGPILDASPPAMRCAPAGDAQAGDPCAGFFDCAAGLRCDLVGITGVCGPDGTGDLGAVCAGDADCAAPLACSRTRQRCEIPLLGGAPGFPELSCPEPDIERFRVLFEVPDGTRADDDFFRLPFPNDIRRTPEGIDLSGFPHQNTAAIAGPIMDAAVAALQDGGPDGFSQNPVVVFRFSRTFDLESVRSGDGDSAPVIDLIDITPGSEDFGRSQTRAWRLNTGRTSFVCRSFATVRTSWTRPLRPGHTYVAWITREVRDENGTQAVQDADFAAMLAPDPPGDARLRGAWNQYAPLRAYLETQGRDGSDLAAAAVFTTMSTNPVFAGLRDAVADGHEAEWIEAEPCSSSSPGPCGRDCAGAAEGYTEWHARVRLPIWQEGQRPYLNPGDGGAVRLDGDGRAVAQDTEEVCAVLTIPDGDPPAGGWPLLLYAHGTGGDAQSHLRDGTAARVASIAVDAPNLPPGTEGEFEPANSSAAAASEASASDEGSEQAAKSDTTVRIATLGFDGVQHTTRRGGSDLSAESLFFNPLNPAAGRGNVEQGVGDLMALLHLVRESADNAPAAFDPSRVLFLGHSQGATVGAPFLATVDGVAGAVLSGAGGSFTTSLLTKTAPVDLAAATRFVLRDEAHGDHHPLLALLQTWIDPVDPLNIARFLTRDRAEALDPIPLFMTFGLDDTYTPPPTQEALAAAAFLPLVLPSATTPAALAPVDGPVQDNVRVGGLRVTAGVKTYQPDGYDGHFVAFRHPDARAEVARFLGSVVAGEPVIGSR